MMSRRRERPRAYIYKAVIDVKPTTEGGPKSALESPVWSFRATVTQREEAYQIGIVTESGEALDPGARAEKVSIWFFDPPVGSNVEPGTAVRLWVLDRVVGSGLLIGFERSVEPDS